VVPSQQEDSEMREIRGALVAALILIGCGASSSAMPDQSGLSTSETSSAGPTEISAEPVSPEPQGPSRVMIQVMVDGQPAAGEVRLLTVSGGLVGEGLAGTSFEVEPGQYRAYGRVSDRSVLADTTERRAADRVTVSPGQELSSNIEFTTSRVRLTVVRGGRAVRAWRVELRPTGSDETVLEVTPSTDYIAVTAGSYSALVHMGRTQIEVSGLVFPPGARIQLPIRVQ